MIPPLATDLGPLSDPTTSEQALSLLRTEIARLGIAWPDVPAKTAEQNITLSLVKLEQEALRVAESARIAGDSLAWAHRRVSYAAYWTDKAIRARRTRRDSDETHYANNAREHLDRLGDGR